MKRILLASAALALTMGAAHADQFAAVYGNTVTNTGPDGKKTVIYVNADKTWEQHRPDGTVLKGTFTWKDDTHACFTQTDPAPADPSKAGGCDEIKGDHKVGDTWTDKDDKGQTWTMSITAGR
ncbi:MAG: hypothetical protein HY243_17455 [Proteobacteria bacterium]|nr:hypothetical protein [Pseudomonadota bacterium]